MKLLFHCNQCREGTFQESTKNKLECPNCGIHYPIINEIPRIVNLDNYSKSFGYQWNIFRKTQLDSYSGFPISKKRLDDLTQWHENVDLTGQLILEAGSGSGRFTEVLVKTPTTIFSFDYSDAVEANFRNHNEYKNLHLFQGDIFNIPFKQNTFDHVFCLGVLQHTPDPEEAFYCLADQVKFGGYIYFDVYTRSWHHYIHWKYFLRPITTKINQEKLLKLISILSPKLIPIARLLRRLFGRFGARLVPIVEYSHLGLSKKINLEWSILDTFDMYSPKHDHPQSKKNVEHWLKTSGFKKIILDYGQNGVICKAQKIEKIKG